MLEGTYLPTVGTSSVTAAIRVTEISITATLTASQRAPLDDPKAEEEHQKRLNAPPAPSDLVRLKSRISTEARAFLDQYGRARTDVITKLDQVVQSGKSFPQRFAKKKLEQSLVQLARLMQLGRKDRGAALEAARLAREIGALAGSLSGGKIAAEPATGHQPAPTDPPDKNPPKAGELALYDDTWAARKAEMAKYQNATYAFYGSTGATGNAPGAEYSAKRAAMFAAQKAEMDALRPVQGPKSPLDGTQFADWTVPDSDPNLVKRVLLGVKHMMASVEDAPGMMARFSDFCRTAGDKFYDQQIGIWDSFYQPSPDYAAIYCGTGKKADDAAATADHGMPLPVLLQAARNAVGTVKRLIDEIRQAEEAKGRRDPWLKRMSTELDNVQRGLAPADTVVTASVQVTAVEMDVSVTAAGT